MSNLEKTNSQILLGDEQIKTLVDAAIIPANTPPEQVALFAEFCRRKNLDPFSNQVYLLSYGQGDRKKYHRITGIDGYRAIAERTGAYAGSSDAVFENDAAGKPVSATITIKKIVQGHICEFSATARMSEYRNEYNPIWNKMPHVMLAKVAEALALRKSFPDALSGLYIKEEFDQAQKTSEPVHSDSLPQQAPTTHYSSEPQKRTFILKDYAEDKPIPGFTTDYVYDDVPAEAEKPKEPEKTALDMILETKKKLVKEKPKAQPKSDPRASYEINDGLMGKVKQTFGDSLGPLEYDYDPSVLKMLDDDAVKPEKEKQKSESEIREYVRSVVLQMTKNDQAEAKKLLETLTSFVDKDDPGKLIPGVSSTTKLGGKRLYIAYGKVKKHYAVWKSMPENQ